jgi:hypothetical protein
MGLSLVQKSQRKINSTAGLVFAKFSSAKAFTRKYFLAEDFHTQISLNQFVEIPSEAVSQNRTQEMLHRLWEPILWRHLRAANENVRSNAAEFLLFGFPIENPNEEIEIRAEKQVDE